MKRRDAIRGAAGLTVVLGAGGCAVATRPSPSTANTVSTKLTRKLSLAHPLFCAGMAFVCDKPDLAIAVTNAGGAGCLSGTLLSPPTLAATIAEIKGRTSGYFHVNQLIPFPHNNHVDVCIDQGVPAMSFHWGHPEPTTVQRLRDAGTGVWVQVGSVEDAARAAGYGVSGVIAQGSEAGGHNYGQLPLAVFLASVREAVGPDVLVLGAGGVSDGPTAAAALMAGADGVWVGTRMVATTEANAHPEYQRRLVEARGEDTVLTGIYGPEMPAFNPIRVVRNATVDRWNHRLDEVPRDRSNLDPIGRTLMGEREIDVRPFDSFGPVPETEGDFDQMPIMAGQGVGLVRSVEPAASVVESMMDQAAATIASYSL